MQEDFRVYTRAKDGTKELIGRRFQSPNGKKRVSWMVPVKELEAKTLYCEAVDSQD